MKSDAVRGAVAAAAAVTMAIALGVLGCGGGSSGGSGNPAGPSGPGASPETAATITITANGVSPVTTRIQAGQAVRFVNSDSVMHVPSSNPHPTHSDCPGINSAGSLGPGASGATAVLNDARSCGFHDHNNPDDARFRGQIVIGNAPELPGY